MFNPIAETFVDGAAPADHVRKEQRSDAFNEDERNQDRQCKYS